MTKAVGDPVWRCQFKAEDGRMTTIFFAVDREGVVHSSPKGWNQFDGIQFQTVKKMIRKIDDRMDLRISGMTKESA